VRVLTSAVLGTEAVTVLLAIPVAVVAGSLPSQVAWVLAGIAVTCAVLPGAHARRWYLLAGWATQVAVIASGVWVPMMYALGLMFAALWWLAIRVGSKPGQRRAAV
jgi:hypothetical protein